MKTTLILGSAFCFFGAVTMVACGDDETDKGDVAGCEADPWSCDAGKVCWINGTSTGKPTGYECLTSGAGKIGETCVNFIGTPSCGDGLACLMLQGQKEGTCEPHCNGKHACAGGLCTPMGFVGLKGKLQVCVPTGGGGGTGGAPAGGTGGVAVGGAPAGGTGGAPAGGPGGAPAGGQGGAPAGGQGGK